MLYIFYYENTAHGHEITLKIPQMHLFFKYNVTNRVRHELDDNLWSQNIPTHPNIQIRYNMMFQHLIQEKCRGIN